MTSGTETSLVTTFTAGGRDASREELALREVGVTNVRRRVAFGFVLLFLATIGVVPLLQVAREARPGLAGSSRGVPQALDAFRIPVRFVEAGLAGKGSAWSRLMAANRAALAEIGDFTDDLEDRSWFVDAFLPGTQAVLLRLGAGNEKAYVGNDGWLFYRPDVDYLTGPGFLPAVDADYASSRVSPEQAVSSDPIPAILDFHRQLRARGIELIVLPVPSKAAIVPAGLASGGVAGTLENPSYSRFVDWLHEGGVEVFATSRHLYDWQQAHETPAYLRADTHWTPDAMEVVSSALAERVESFLRDDPAPSMDLQTLPVEVTSDGDIATMLRLPRDQHLIDSQTVQIRQVLRGNGNFWRPAREAEVLLLGDSFSNIYSLREMDWGESAGLAERLSYHLRRPVDAIRRNDQGAFATREALARDLGRGVDRLAGKRVVIWEFAERELAQGNWKLLSMGLGEAPPRRFIVPPEGEDWSVTGVVESIAETPRPGTVPYRDHIVAMHLGDLRGVDGKRLAGDAIVYAMSMRNNRWTPFARVREGERLELKLHSWSDVAPDLERINRSELPDVELQFEEPCWGEWISKQ